MKDRHGNEYIYTPNFENEPISAFGWELIGITAFAVFLFLVIIV